MNQTERSAKFTGAGCRQNGGGGSDAKAKAHFCISAPWTAEHVPWTRGRPLQASEETGPQGATARKPPKPLKNHSFSLVFLGLGAVWEACAARGPGAERHPRGARTVRTSLASSMPVGCQLNTS